jgi:quinol monooxygenase YgiN
VVKVDEHNEVVLVAEVTALPGKHDELLRAFDDLIPKALAEAGVSAFRLHEDREQPGHFLLYERYHSQSSVESHFATDHFLAISQAIAKLAEGGKPKIISYQILSD